MEGRRLGVLGAALCAALAGSAVAAEKSALRDLVGDSEIRVESSAAEVTFEPARGGIEAAPVKMFRLPPDLQLETLVYSDGPVPVVAGNSSERLFYSNTMGRVAVDAGQGNLVADDISTSAPNGCKLTRFAFEITGQTDPNDPLVGSYTVTWALYNTCPGAVSAAVRPQRIIAGTSGSMLVPPEMSSLPLRIEHVIAIPDGIAIPTNVWLGMSFTRDNAGPIMGAPAQEGFSQDLYHSPGFNCSVFLGGFPNAPHASMNAEVWGGTEMTPCAPTNIQYHAHRETGITYNPGADLWVTDDIGLITPTCRMVGFETTVRGAGRYEFEFRNICESCAISGSNKVSVISPNNPETRNVAHTFDTPIQLPQNFQFAVKVNNSNAGVVVAGVSPAIGFTSDLFFAQTSFDPPPPTAPCPPTRECAPLDAIAGQEDALSLTIICEGEAQSGACCDMFVPECVGGKSEGLGCESNKDCEPPGTCEVLCRELPRINCSFPAQGTEALPDWEAGDACTPDPFPNLTCGQAACCHRNALGQDVCLNLTENQCDAQPPTEEPRQWQTGRICGILQQRCPLHACLARTGSCKIPNIPPPNRAGCDNPDCCSGVCIFFDEFCCQVNWDASCVEFANALPDFCGSIRPPNDECAGSRPGLGAHLIANFPANHESDGSNATPDYLTLASPPDPPICCHTGTPLVCLTGDDEGLVCTTNEDCGGGGVCDIRPAKALHTVWYKFVAPASGRVGIDTCTGNGAPFNDSVVQVFDSADPSSDQTACPSLTPIVCADDTAGCGGGKNARVCATNLIPGRTYYAMVGAKTHETSPGDYNVVFSSTCTPPAGGVVNDWCQNATVAAAGPPESPGITAYNLTGTTLDCPAAACAPDTTKDMWFEYTATKSGTADIDLCFADPDTNLVVYEGCDTCPGLNTPEYACNRDAEGNFCGAGSPASAILGMEIVTGKCYKIRVGNNGTNTPSGQLKIAETSLCDAGPVTFLDPPNGVVDAGRPHDPFAIDPALGLQEIRVQGPTGVGRASCWKVECETVRPGGDVNGVESVVETAPGSGIWVVRLLRPISTMGFTSVRYVGNPSNDNASVMRMIAHPSNVNADFVADTGDVIALVSGLTDLESDPPPVLSVYQYDVDRSGMVGPLDILDTLDLFNGAQNYDSIYLNSFRPAVSPCLP